MLTAQSGTVPIAPGQGIAAQPGRLTDFALLLVCVLVCALLCALICAAVLHRLRALKNATKRAQREASTRIRETDDLADDLLQGVQGLVLTFHVAAQNITEGHASKKLLNHALSQADKLLSDGRKRFERVAFHPASDQGSSPGRHADHRTNAFKSGYLAGRHSKRAAKP